jgi:thymidylate synthase (FAD)
VSGVSRALSHQLVRHRIGISFEQQSQRYVRYKEERLDYVMPKTWTQAGMQGEYDRLMGEITRVYEAALAKGIPAEDARFVLPNATPTNFQIMVNLTELLHIADLRLCWRAQWEIRHMVALMRREVTKVLPEIGAYLQPKCGDKRMGYCYEPVKEWERCPLGKVRPHKEQILDVFRQYRAGNLVPLGEEHLRAVEDAGNEE